MSWELITNIILILAFLALGFFVLLGLCQWIKRGSLKKVDKEILCMSLPLLIMTIVYFVFDKFLILNTRPNGSGESSFPSTHVMVVATIFFLIIVILPKYVKSKTARIILEIFMSILVCLTCVGRVLANLHWPLDVIGGLIFAFVFSEIYYFMLKKLKQGKNHE